MRKRMLLFALALSGNVVAAERVPVLVELFTSEGCSSCPPADRLLERLDRESPSRIDAIVLSEHVDYWNSLGWRDPFSSAAMTQRQRDYARRLGGDVYTPEMVVDGARGFVGSNSSEALQALAEAADRTKAVIRVDVAPAGSKSRISVHLERPVAGTLFVALARDAMRSKVTAGENSGKNLTHVAVVYSLVRVGRMDGLERTVDVDQVVPGARVVAFVSDGVGGAVLALGSARP